MYKVIVADDEEELRLSLIRRVKWEEIGFEVVGQASNGAEALELVEKLAPDLLLSDIRMPYMSGIELARAVREVRPAVQIAFLSGYDDFAYAQQAIQYNIISYMLKPITLQSLTEELKNIKIRIDRKFEEFMHWSEEQERQSLKELIIPLVLDFSLSGGTYQREEKLREDLTKLGFLPHAESRQGFTVMTVCIRDDDGNNLTTPSSVNAVDIILSKYITHFSFYSGGKVVSLLTATEADFSKYLHIIVEDIAQSVKRIMGRQTAIGVSRTVTQLTNCHAAYGEAVNAMESFHGGGGVSFITDIERSDTLIWKTIQDSISYIEILIRGGTVSDIEEYLNNLFDYMEREKVSAPALMPFVVQLEACVYRVVFAVVNGDALDSLLKESPLHGHFLNTPADIRKQCLSFSVAAKELLSEQQKRSSADICMGALSIIENRYMDTMLSLVSISEELSVSPNYLSSLIKKHSGSTFVELLTKKRIETAKELIAGTPMKIGEISEMCGYNDQHYFSYCFKKYVGESPRAFRSKIESNV